MREGLPGSENRLHRQCAQAFFPHPGCIIRQYGVVLVGFGLPRRAGFDPFSPSVGSWRVEALYLLLPLSLLSGAQG